MKRLVLTLLIAATALMAGTSLAPAGIASAYPPGQTPVGIRINVVAVRPTETFTVTISPCTPGERVIFRFRNQSVTTTCDPTTLSASATFTPMINPGRGRQGFAPRPHTAQPLVAQAAIETEVPAPGVYDVCGDVTGDGATVPVGTTRPLTLCTSIEVLADVTEPTTPPVSTTPDATTPDATSPTTPPVATTPGGGLPATGSSGLGTSTTSAIVLIAAGALLLIVTQVRRRRSSTAT